MSLFPTVFRRIFRLIRVGFPPLEKSPGGFWRHVPFRIRFPKPPWNLFYIQFFTVIVFLCLNEVITISDDIWQQRGFFDFAIEIVLLHRHRVIDPDFLFLKSGKDFPSQIWDLGILIFGVEDNEIQSRIITIHSILISVFQILFLSHASSRLSHYIPDFPVHRYTIPMFKDLRLAQKRQVMANPMIPEKYTDQQEDFGFLLNIEEASTLLRWLLDYWDWILVSLGSQVVFRNGTFNFKKRKHLQRQQIWVMRQRRLSTDQYESFLESSNVLISTKRQDTVLSSTTLSSHFKSKVMLKAFWSFSSKLIATNKYVKEGHNRFYLLARKASDSRVTLHSFIEIVSISYICVQWLFCIYSVFCKLL